MPKALKILAILLVSLTTSLSAQTDFITKPTADSTTTKPTADRSILVKDTMRINERYELIHPVYNLEFYIEENLDTSVQNIHYYLPTEQDTEIWQQASNLGQPAYMLSVPDAKPLNIRLGTPNTSVYNFNRTNTPFYQNDAPYTYAGYITGADNEQIFNVQHAQNFSSLIGIALKYRFIGSNGAYQNQAASLNNIGANVWLKTPNKKYNFLFSYINNGQKRKQNGGVENSEGLFESSSQFRLNQDTYLSNAESRGKDSELFFQHSYDLGITKDSLNTEDSVYVSWLVPTVRFIHRFSSSTQQRNYFDDAPPNGFYANEYYTNSQISDYTKLKKYANEFLIAWEGRINEQETGIKAVGGFEYITGKTNWEVADTDSTKNYWENNFNSFLVKAKAFTTPDLFIKNLQLKTDFQYGVSGWNANNIYWKTNASYELLKDWNATFGYVLSSQQPSQMFNQFHGATNNWNLDLKPLIQNSVSLGVRYKRLAEISFKTSQIKNYTYLNSFQVPEQIEKSVLLQEIKLASHINFFKHWNWRGKANFQLEDRIEIAIPQLWLNTEFYFEGKVFKSALEMQAGLMLTYISSFNTNTFSPSTGLFYNKTQLINQYPLADIFFNFKIKRANIFVRSSHLFQNLPGMPGMFAHPDYPLPDRAFKFGFSWGFYD